MKRTSYRLEAFAIFVLVTITAPLMAQMPTITSFTPENGPVGTSVTVTGTGFDSTPANNIVFFGDTQATVTSSSTTQLMVVVPAGATYQPITVVTNELMAFSARPFVVSFPSDGTGIDASSFAAGVNFSTNTGPIFNATGDLDGDGKAELVVANLSDNNISVFRNTSAGIGSINYDAKVDFDTGDGPIAIAFGDLDSDGKPDLVVANRLSSTVSVFLNTSTAVGSISFAAKVDFTTGIDPREVAIGDLDGDGKADLAVVNLSGRISVLRNIGTGTGLTAFDPKIDFVSGGSPRSVTIGDLDGDGKMDMASVNGTTNSMSVLLNTSLGAGSIDFADAEEIATEGLPKSIGIGDLDGDNLLDLAIVNANGGSFSTFRNTSTGGGDISFAAKADYATGTFPRAIALGDLNGDGKVDVALINENSNSLSVFTNTSTGPGTISYASKVDFPLGTTPVSLSIGDHDSDGQADLIATNFADNTVSILRNTVTKTIASAATEIIAFSFAEQTMAITPNILNQTIDIEVEAEANVSNLIAFFTLSTGATAQINNADQLSGTTPNDFTNQVTYVITSEDETKQQNWVVTVTQKEDLANPEISASQLPKIYPAGSSGIPASITVSDNVGIAAVTFYSKKSNATNYSEQVLTIDNGIYSVTLTEALITDIGLEYYFLAEDANQNNVATDTVQIVIQYSQTNNARPIPNLSTGGKAANWRMISIPYVLNNSSVATLFESVLGTYDQTKWRLFHYKNDLEEFVEYKKGLSTIERGKGYWFNSLEQASIPMGPGTAPVNSQENLATIVLTKGWNQIGNPYAFDVSWSDVLNHNGITNEVESNLRITNNGTSLSNSSVLKAYSAAYLLAAEEITLEIPMLDNSGGRMAQNSEFDEGWLLNLNLATGIFDNKVSGLGMHPEAISINDRYDQIRAPRFAKYIDASFHHPEYFKSQFSRDVVSVQENFVWEFDVSTNIEAEVRILSWELSSLPEGQNLILVDKTNGSVIDMQNTSSYSYRNDMDRKFKAVYGDRMFLNSQFSMDNVHLGTNYPNPFASTTTIPFAVHGSGGAYKVKLDIYSINGKFVKTLIDEQMSSGVYATQWDGTDQSGKRTLGMFIYNLEVQTDTGIRALKNKMIVQ